MDEEVTYLVFCGVYPDEKNKLSSSEGNRKTQSYLWQRLVNISRETKNKNKQTKTKTKPNKKNESNFMFQQVVGTKYALTECLSFREEVLLTSDIFKII